MDGVTACAVVPFHTLTDGVPLRFGALVVNRRQPATAIERTAPDRGHATTNSDIDQRAAVIERNSHNFAIMKSRRRRGEIKV